MRLVHPNAIEYLNSREMQITDIINSKNYNPKEIEDVSIFTHSTLLSVIDTDGKEHMLLVNDFNGEVDFYSSECIVTGNLFKGIDFNKLERIIEKDYLGRKVIFDSMHEPEEQYNPYSFTLCVFIDEEETIYHVTVKNVNGDIVDIVKI